MEAEMQQVRNNELWWYGGLVVALFLFGLFGTKIFGESAESLQQQCWRTHEKHARSLTGDRQIAYLFSCEGQTLGGKVYMGQEPRSTTKLLGIELQTLRGETGNCSTWRISGTPEQAHFVGVRPCNTIK